MSTALADQPEDKMPTKSSWGVILCRRNATTGRPEALLVHKRYTYAFSDFIHGRYACGRPPPGIVPPPRTVAELLDDMTREELFLVWSLEFGSMWYHVWLTCENRELYGRKCAKFQSSFMRDGGVSLRAQVTRAHARGALLWEVPKGRRLSAREADIICSVRETREETGIDKGEYRLLPGVKRRVSYVSGRVRYICVYYIALAYPRLTESNHCCTRWLSLLRSIHQMAEVSEVRWCDIEHLRLLDEGSKRLESLIKPAFRLIKIYSRGRWAARRANPHHADDCDAILHSGPPPTGAPPAENGERPFGPRAAARANTRGPPRTNTRGAPREPRERTYARPANTRTVAETTDAAGWQTVSRIRRKNEPHCGDEPRQSSINGASA